MEKRLAESDQKIEEVKAEKAQANAEEQKSNSKLQGIEGAAAAAFQVSEDFVQRRMKEKHEECYELYRKLGKFDYGPAPAGQEAGDRVVKQDVELSDGRYYEGEVNAAGEPNGRGMLIYGSGIVKESHWKNGRLNGRAREINIYGSWFEVEYEEGYRNGKGTYHWPDGDKDEGTWAAEYKHGKFKRTKPDGRVGYVEWD